MPNHYHLLIHTPLANLSQAIKYLNGLYTQRYNKLLKTDGPLFRGRFKSIIVDADNYLLTLSRYIHLNPVVAKIVKLAEKYPWSSCPAYFGTKMVPQWLTTKFILGKFGNKMQRQKYRIFITEGIDKELDSFFNKVKRLPILGSEAFRKTISETYLKNKHLSPEISEYKRLYKLQPPKVIDIMQIVAVYYKVDIANLKYVQPGGINIPRAVAIYLACQITGQNLQHISKHFTNITSSGISQVHRRIKQKMRNNADLANEIACLENKLMSSM